MTMESVRITAVTVEKEGKILAAGASGDSRIARGKSGNYLYTSFTALPDFRTFGTFRTLGGAF